MKVVNQEIKIPHHPQIQLAIKREDLIHPFISGNKYRKLKYNLIEARSSGYDTLLTFGGAYSNHIAATAFAGNINGFKTIGIIRGEEIKTKISENETLKFAQKQGMILSFLSRENYRHKNDMIFLDKLKDVYGNVYILPEGGTNRLAVKGCEEILTKDDEYFDIICTCVGTGGTISGLINSALSHQKILGFPALKGSFLNDEICNFALRNNWELIADYHFGGYAKINAELVSFINTFKRHYDISLDPIYTGKMMYGLFDLINKGYFPEGSKILAIHSGGLQGIQGMNSFLKKKNLPLIDV